MTERDREGRIETAEQTAQVDERQRQLYELEQRILAEELEHANQLREIFHQHETVIAMKIKQLRQERGWSQDDLAERMTKLGFSMHQTTIAKLEAGRRPIRVAETFALAAAFSLDPMALWYLPVKEEPRTFASMREDLKKVDDAIAEAEAGMEYQVKQYAFWQERRTRLAAAMNEASRRLQELRARLSLAESNYRRAQEEEESLAKQIGDHETGKVKLSDEKFITLRSVHMVAQDGVKQTLHFLARIRNELDRYGKEEQEQ